LPSVGLATLDKVASLRSAKVWRSAKLLVVGYRLLLMALCRASPFVERLTLDKEVFVEYLFMPSFLLSVNMVVTKNTTVLSASTGKDFFTECPTKNTRQRAGF
jgi:hypothetical protein